MNFGFCSEQNPLNSDQKEMMILMFDEDVGPPLASVHSYKQCRTIK